MALIFRKQIKTKVQNKQKKVSVICSDNNNTEGIFRNYSLFCKNTSSQMFDMVLNIPMGRKSHLLTLSSVAFSSSNAITPARENKIKKSVYLKWKTCTKYT